MARPPLARHLGVAQGLLVVLLQANDSALPATGEPPQPPTMARPPLARHLGVAPGLLVVLLHANDRALPAILRGRLNAPAVAPRPFTSPSGSPQRHPWLGTRPRCPGSWLPHSLPSWHRRARATTWSSCSRHPPGPGALVAEHLQESVPHTEARLHESVSRTEARCHDHGNRLTSTCSELNAQESRKLVSWSRGQGDRLESALSRLLMLEQRCQRLGDRTERVDTLVSPCMERLRIHDQRLGEMASEMERFSEKCPSYDEWSQRRVICLASALSSFDQRDQALKWPREQFERLDKAVTPCRHETQQRDRQHGDSERRRSHAANLVTSSCFLQG